MIYPRQIQVDSAYGGMRPRNEWICPALVFGILVTTLEGCAPKLAGGWETVDVQPAGASFPFNRIQFDATGKYTATGLYDGSGRMTDEVRTTTGDFRQSGAQ